MADFERARVEAGDDRDALLRYYVNMSDTLHLLGRFDDSLDVANQGFELARSAGVERTSGAILVVNTVDPLFALGEWDRADALIESSLELNPPTVFRIYLRRAKMRSTLWRGDPRGALAQFEQWSASGLQLAEFEDQTRAGLALDLAGLKVALGDLQGAWEQVLPLIDMPRLASPGWELPLAGAAAHVLARLREAAHDPALLRDEEKRLRALVARDHWPTLPIWTAVVDAELSGDDGTGTDVGAWQVARDAVAAPEGSVLTRLVVDHGLARAQLLSGDRAGATETIAGLRAAAGAVGAGLIVGWADDLASRGGLAGHAVDTTADDRALTSREQQVLELVAEGLSNGQIAERLYISRKTVSVHVSAILRKLGAASRTEAVRLAALAANTAG